MRPFTSSSLPATRSARGSSPPPSTELPRGSSGTVLRPSGVVGEEGSGAKVDGDQGLHTAGVSLRGYSPRATGPPTPRALPDCLGAWEPRDLGELVSHGLAYRPISHLE